MASAHIMTLLPVNTWRSGLAKLANAQAHTLGTDTPVPEDEENREDGLGQAGIRRVRSTLARGTRSN